MSTVDKALSLLDLFSESRPNMKLSEIARVSGWDKSNVQRYAKDLTRRGLLEQDPRDKTYFLGHAITRLAKMRDVTHPIASEVMRVLEDLVEAAGETAHASTLTDGKLMNSGIAETKIRGTRVYIDPSEALPFHASASGLAYLSALPDVEVKKILAGKLTKFTTDTTVDRQILFQLVSHARERGFSCVRGSFESDVVGVAAPVRGFAGAVTGAVSVATPVARFTDQSEEMISSKVIQAAGKISKILGAGE